MVNNPILGRHAVRFVAVASALVMALITAPGTAGATHSWRIVDLGVGDNSYATAINERGHVVGVANGRAFLWRNGQVTYLGYGDATDINNHDEIVGNFDFSSGFLWRDGVITPLPGRAAAINDRGEVVGTSYSDYYSSAFLWRDGVTTYLDSLPDTFGSEARDIDNAGVVVGAGREIAPLSDHIVRWRHGNVEAVSTTERGYAVAVNARGSITGTHWAGTPEGAWRHYWFVWHQGEFISIAPPPGETFVQPQGINDRTQVVGETDRDAFVWQAGRMTLLPRLLSTTGAYDINNRGQIVGASSVRSDGLNRHAVLWVR